MREYFRRPDRQFLLVFTLCGVISGLGLAWAVEGTKEMVAIVASGIFTGTITGGVFIVWEMHSQAYYATQQARLFASTEEE